jgi:thioredoxin-like negative regulator of GroEL
LVKVYCDENKETAEAAGIKALPTFQFYKKGEKIDELKGDELDEERLN